MKKHISAVILMMLILLAAPSSGLAREACFGQDSSGRGKAANPCYTPKCYRDLNGHGEIIRWAKTERQCRHQSNGQSWGYPGNAVNIYHDVYAK